MEIKFEIANIEDAEVLVEVRNLSFFSDYIKYGECPGYNISIESMTNTLLNTKIKSYKIFSDEKVVGNISVRENNDNTCYIGCLCVIPSYENRGIGQHAIRFVEKEFSNVTVWSLETPADKERNHYFYKKLGYNIVDEYMSGSVKVVLFEKKLLCK
ncbi:GNAT family N-acetyltransferase [Clostridium fungisolvens]|uniref:N-acetyltransferase domain-containing protein n=1 Tax=Clostridium fungisolvens TaxID=1604897 RepID=A0A6V8SF35_9CLOT|nr:GNAT family N-acetyltransferase [Clostridium fungisolvens]GFP75326.1 hypothetical protein bsdtw1_01400 [Clostridium fungisolvens]